MLQEPGAHSDTSRAHVSHAVAAARRFQALAYSDRWLVRKPLAFAIRTCCNWHVHPNALTLAALVLSAAIPFLHYARAGGSVVAGMIVRQVLDCMDGEVARRSNRTSSLGAKLDTLSDAVFYLALISIVVSAFTSQPYRIAAWSVLVFGGWLATHAAICGKAALSGHSITDYDSPSLYRRSYAFVVNNSVVLVGGFCVVYEIWLT